MGIYDPDIGRVFDYQCVTFCAGCGEEMLKKRMVTVYAKERQYGNPKVIGHFCTDCYYNFLERYELKN